MSVESYTISSGLEVYVDHIPHAATTFAVALVKGGSLVEIDEEAGLGHLVEHCVLDGTQQLPDPETIRDFTDRHGLSWNGMSNVLNTYYFAHGRNFPAAMEFLHQVTLQPTLRESTVEKEITIVSREAEMQLDDAEFLGTIASLQLMCGIPYGRPVIGYHNHLDYAPQTVRKFYRQCYHLGNMALIAVGAASIEEVIASASGLMSGQVKENAHTMSPEESQFPEPQPAAAGEYGIATAGLHDARVALHHRLPLLLRGNLAIPERRVAYQAAQYALYDYVMYEIREEHRLAYKAGYYIDTDNHPLGWVAGAYANCAPVKDRQVATLLQNVMEAADTISTGLKERQLNSLIGSAYREMDDIESRAGKIITSVSAGEQPIDPHDEVKLYKNLSLADIDQPIAELCEAFTSQPRYTTIESHPNNLVDLPLFTPRI